MAGAEWPVRSILGPVFGCMLLGAFLATGCAGRWGARSAAGRQAARADSAATALRWAALDERLTRIEAAQRDTEALLRSTNAALSAQLEDLAAQVTAVGERVAARERWSATLARQDRGGPPPGPGDMGPSEGAAVPLDGGAPGGSYPPTAEVPRAAGEASGTPAADPGDAPPEAMQLYDAAYQDLQRDNYQLALISLRGFLTRYPQTSLADNAQYWIGEAYYAQGQYENAIEEFRRVIDEYPGQDKEPAAYYKIALSFRALRDPASARRYLRVLVERFPDTREAQLARELIPDL